MDTFQLFDELLKKPNEEIKWAIFSLMIKKKLNSHELFDLYMQAIEHDKEDLKDRLSESNSSLLEMVLYSVKSKAKGFHAVLHRALYNLNQSKQFNMSGLNEKYSYNEEEAKNFSWYWREHNKQ